MTPVVLASTSAVRSVLLTAAGVVFERMNAGVDEGKIKQAMLDQTASPMAIAAALAEAKALAVSARNPGLVIGADQTLELDGGLFDKPADLTAARTQLLALRGRTHRLHAAVALALAGAVVWRLTASVALTVRDFSDGFLETYLAQNAEACLSSVGCYHLEGAGIQLFERVEGDYFAVLGLPLVDLLAELRARGALPA